MKRSLRATTLTPLVIPDNLQLGHAVLMHPCPQKPAPAPKRVRWITLREECEAAMDRLKGAPDFDALLLVTEVLLHVADGTEGSVAAQRAVETMRRADSACRF